VGMNVANDEAQLERRFVVMDCLRPQALYCYALSMSPEASTSSATGRHRRRFRRLTARHLHHHDDR